MSVASTKRDRGTIIEKVPGEKYLVRIYLGRDVEGKRQYTSKTVLGDAGEARKALTALLHDADTGKVVISPRLNVAEFLDQWLDAIETSIEPRTLLFYRQNVRLHLVPLFGKVRFTALTPIQVQTGYSKLSKKGLSPRSVHHAHAVLRAAFRWARTMRLLSVIPTDGVTLPKVQVTKAAGSKGTFSAEQAKALLAASQEAGDSLTALWRLLLECGVRPSEARALRWDDLGEIIVEGRVWKTVRVERAVQVVGISPRREEVRGTKTDRSRRTIPMTTSLVEALEAHRRAQAAAMLRLGPAFERSGLIFTARGGQMLTPETLLKRWRKACRRVGLPELRAYDARHTAATLLLEAGVPLKVVSEILGHATTAQTADTYSHVTATMAVAATSAMESTLSGPRAASGQ